MSSLIVEICRIEKILPHPNADKLELAHIKGWQVVIGKDLYQPGQLVTYVPIDSLLPAPLSDRLGVTKYLSSGRVRCAKLRGEPSFGLLFPREDESLAEGTDVAARYGITKYLPPVRPSAGDAAPESQLFASYTSIENLRNFPGVFVDGEPVLITEKIHGTNCRVGLVEGEWMAGSKDIRRTRPSDEALSNSTYWFPTTVPGVKALVEELGRDHRQVVLFGEVYGSKIQSLAYGKVGQFGFTAFDLLVDGRYLDSEDFEARCDRHGVPRVPALFRGPFALDQVKALSVGDTTLGAKHIREGVVVKPQKERSDPKVGRVIMKYIGDDYLLSKGISDTHDT
jgi:RNA ligase (TIGR02306 family)